MTKKLLHLRFRAVSRFNAIVFGSQVRARNDEVNVSVRVVVLLKIGWFDLFRQGGNLRRITRQPRQYLLQLVVVDGTGIALLLS